ncbi:MAG TPA: HlyD family efflux transporter periplasmic adaptor subunit [Verrucomicrobiae bacterium]|nr:HlyD family efflux transporter periplasmic adaptor subunit [Verrucomicrobiae bacterium]
MVRVYLPHDKAMYVLPPNVWQLCKLFDGKRSYEQIAEQFSSDTSTHYDVEQVRELADGMEANGFWYKTPQEKNIALMSQSLDERRKKVKSQSKWADLSEITFPAFNPDRFLTWLYSHTKFIYTTWFTILTLIAFAIAAAITITHWAEIGRDTVEFYNFSHKTWGDVLLLYAVSMIVVAVHESAHAHACKHCGGRVPAMGFALVYLAPAFYTDTTEGAVLGTRAQRLVIYVAGVWSELMLYSIATPIWWGTPPDTLIHDGAYYIMLLTGIMSLVLNWNPLMKLDGYFILSEILAIEDLKENSTAFVSAWVKKNIWGLPVEVPYVPRSRRFSFFVYSALSGVYSYLVLFVIARFAGNIVRNFSPDWGFVPEIAVALLIFRSRIRALVNFMKFLYLDKKDRIFAWFNLSRTGALALAVLLLVALPLRRESVSGKFILEPSEMAIVRAHVPGRLTELDVREGQFVHSGQTVARVRSLPALSELEQARARLSQAAQGVNDAALKYSHFGEALQEQQLYAAQYHQQAEAFRALSLVSPISGTILTPKVTDLLGSYLPAGTELLEVGDLSSMRARIYISEYDLYKVHLHAHALLQLQGTVTRWKAQVISISSRPTEMDPKLIAAAAFQGMNAPHFYLVELIVQNSDGILKPGMVGYARVYSNRRSLLGLMWESIHNFGGRKLW